MQPINNNIRFANNLVFDLQGGHVTSETIINKNGSLHAWGKFLESFQIHNWAFEIDTEVYFVLTVNARPIYAAKQLSSIQKRIAGLAKTHLNRRVDLVFECFKWIQNMPVPVSLKSYNEEDDGRCRPMEIDD